MEQKDDAGQPSLKDMAAHAGAVNDKTGQHSEEATIDIGYIKKVTRKAGTKFTVPDWNDSLVAVSTAFLEKFLFDAPVSVGYARTFLKDTPDSFRFYQHKDLERHFLFSVVYADESCCRIVYGITVDKGSRKIVDIALLSLSGGDGGWGEDNNGIWESDTLLNLLKVEINYEDFEDNEVVIDSVRASIHSGKC